MLEREHAAPRRPEQVDSLEPQLRTNGPELVAENADVPIDAVGAVGSSAAELVVDDDSTFVG